MRKQRVISVAALLCTAIGLVGCGGGGKSSACKHTYVVDKEKSVAATCTTEGKEIKVCSKCGDVKETKKSKTSHEYEEDTTKAKAATCTEPGSKTMVCKNCGNVDVQTINALDHEWVDDEDQTGAKQATCEEGGEVKQHCSRCTATRTDTTQPAGHKYVDAEDQTGAKAATCFEAGTKIQECSTCHDKKEVPVAATGHQYDETTPIVQEGYPTMQKATCKAGDSTRLYWSAGDVTDACKAGSGYIQEGGTEAEPNIVEESGGWRFFGRPVGNKGILGSDGSATEDAQAEDADKNVVGSYFEYKIKLQEELKDMNLMCECTPASYCQDIFITQSGQADWTKGFRFDADGNATAITDVRYIVYVDGTVYELDPSVSTKAGNGSAWYAFPISALNLAAGEHTIRIVMSGGYRHIFTSFGLQTKDVKPQGGNDDGGNTDAYSFTLDVANATGYNDKSKKMKDDGSVVGVATFTVDSSVVKPGKYKVDLKAKMTNSSHSDRKWYNMAKAELCINGVAEETKTSNQDRADEDDYRYFLKVGNTVVNPDVKDSWGTIGYDASNYNVGAWITNVTIPAGVTEISINHGTIGYSLYVEAAIFTAIA